MSRYIDLEMNGVITRYWWIKEKPTGKPEDCICGGAKPEAKGRLLLICPCCDGAILGKSAEQMTTKEIREVVYNRQEGRCLDCDKFVTWQQAHLHEIVPRGKGGTISLDNSVILCADCHLNVRHKNRRPKFSKIVLDKESKID